MIVPTLGQCLAFGVPGTMVWAAWGLLVVLVVFFLWLRAAAQFHGRRFFIVANGGIAWWLGAASLELLVPDPACKWVFGALAYPGIVVTPTAWAFFLFRYAYGISGPMRPGHRIALIGGPLAATAMALTSPWHGLFYGPGTAPRDAMPGAPLVYDHGPLFYLVAAWLYVALAAGFALLIVGGLRARPAYRRHFAALFVVGAVPVAGNLAYVVGGRTLGGFDPTPFLFSGTLLAYIWMMSTGTVFEVTALARRLIFDALPNPVLVLGRDRTLLGWNPSAAAVFGSAAAQGRPVGTLPAGGALAAALDAPDDPPVLAVGSRYFEPQVTEILPPVQRDARGIGWVLMLVDITAEIAQRRAVEAALEVRESELDAERRKAEELGRLATVDPGTGLLNRRTLEPAFDLAAAAPAGVALALIDIDHFKRINDSFGHDVGDIVLAGFARRLERAFRGEDRVFRIGGEEFLALCPGMPVEALAERLDALRAPVAAMDEVAHLDGLRVGFSAGIARAPQDGTALPALLAAADARLYAAKAAGRGRTVAGDSQAK